MTLRLIEDVSISPANYREEELANISVMDSIIIARQITGNSCTVAEKYCCCVWCENNIEV